METILQIRSVSPGAKWGIFAGNVLPSRDKKPVPIRTKTNLPKTPCPRCQKGYHWAKDCRSKFHKDGTMLTPQVQGSNFSQFQGNGQQEQPWPQTTIGAVELNPFIPFVPSWNSSEQPQVAQDWTSVPPPQKY